MVLNWLLQQTTTNNQNKTPMLSYSTKNKRQFFMVSDIGVSDAMKNNSYLK